MEVQRLLVVGEDDFASLRSDVFEAKEMASSLADALLKNKSPCADDACLLYEKLKNIYNDVCV